MLRLNSCVSRLTDADQDGIFTTSLTVILVFCQGISADKHSTFSAATLTSLSVLSHPPYSPQRHRTQANNLSFTVLPASKPIQRVIRHKNAIRSVPDRKILLFFCRCGILGLDDLERHCELDVECGPSKRVGA